MTNFQHFSVRVSALALVMTGVFALGMPAWAGFEWTPPPAKPAAPAAAQSVMMPEMPAMPQGEVEATALSESAAAPALNPNPIARKRPPLMNEVAEPEPIAPEPIPVEAQSAPAPITSQVIAASPVVEPSMPVPSAPPVDEMPVDKMTAAPVVAPPPATRPPAPAPLPRQMASSANAEKISSPIDEESVAAAPVILGPDMTADIADTEPAAPAAMPVVEEKEVSMMKLASIAPMSEFEDAVGFGDDMPLALAIRQIIPASYAYTLDSSVDQGARISWNGGRPWNQVLEKALKPQGLKIFIDKDRGLVRVASSMIAPAMSAGHIPSPPPSDAAPSRPFIKPSALPVRNMDRSWKKPSQPVREVYVRRNTSGDPVVQERVPGAPATTESNPSITLTPHGAPSGSVTVTEKKDSTFWSHFGLGSDETTTIRNSDSGDQAMVDNSMKVMESDSADAPSQNDKVVAVKPMADAGTRPMTLSQPPGAVVKKVDDTAGPVNSYNRNFWQAEQGDSLRNVLQSWAQTAGVKLYWVPTVDYKLPAPVRIQGSFTDAVLQALTSYGETGPRPIGRLHPNLPAGPSVLIIEPAANS